MNSKAEVDIITHLAVCASQDWGKVDRIVVGNFVTANQAQRKWYTKIITKVSSGDYKLGAVGGPPLVLQDKLNISPTELCQYHCTKQNNRST
jgi:phosphatidylserine decarboxylase